MKCIQGWRNNITISLKASGHSPECVAQSKYSGRRHKKMRGEGVGEKLESSFAGRMWEEVFRRHPVSFLVTVWHIIGSLSDTQNTLDRVLLVLLNLGHTFSSANKDHSLEIWRTTNIHFSRLASSYTFLLYISFPGWSFQSERLSSSLELCKPQPLSLQRALFHWHQ